MELMRWTDKIIFSLSGVQNLDELPSSHTVSTVSKTVQVWLKLDHKPEQDKCRYKVQCTRLQSQKCLTELPGCSCSAPHLSFHDGFLFSKQHSLYGDICRKHLSCNYHSDYCRSFLCSDNGRQRAQWWVTRHMVFQIQNVDLEFWGIKSYNVLILR